MPLVLKFAIIFGLGFFFGLSFEEFYAADKRTRPGGVRTFPLLALTGGVLYELDPRYMVGVAAGLVVLGAWLAVFYLWELQRSAESGDDHGGIIAPIANVVAFLLGPITLAAPVWLAVGITVSAVFLLTARDSLHRLAKTLDRAEILNVGRFLLLSGFILPVLPDHPVSSLVAITPRSAWLALLAVCGVSYLSYLLQRYFSKYLSGLWIAVLGGLYSSTATTVVISRRMKAEVTPLRQGQAGVILATSVMYLRLLVVVGVFNLALCLRLAPTLVGLSILGCAAALIIARGKSEPIDPKTPPHQSENPLQLKTAAIFAVLFLAVSVASSLARKYFGVGGVYGLSAIVGFTDIDPFVLSLAQGNTGALPISDAAAAILIAASSNNVLKSAYVFAFGGRKAAAIPAVALVLLAIVGLAGAFFTARGFALVR
jgi:uncharacterized membrane protein (DUF4010 family)